MSKHVIVGAGPIGISTARLLVDSGETVTVVTRSGSPAVPGADSVQADATDAAVIGELARGATTLYNCASPAYQRWATDWPPLATALLDAAEKTGAVLVTASNLYGYGAVSVPMTESTRLAPNSKQGRVRVHMWLDALERHQAGRIRATEVRSSDYLGPRAQGLIGERVIRRLLEGKSVQVMKSADAVHTWTYTGDAARLLVTVAQDERAWGKPWHVPSNRARTQREVIADLASVAGVRHVKVSETSTALLKLVGLARPTVRALSEVGYQLKRGFVMDSAAARHTFGLEPTPWDDILAATVEAYRALEITRDPVHR